MTRRRTASEWSAIFTEPVGTSLAFVAILLGSAIFFYFNTAQGIGILTDSTRYMGISARPYDAPLYPWMLWLGAKSGFALTQVAAAIAVVVLVANILLIFLLLARSTGNRAVTALGTAAIAFAPQFVWIHATAMSEPPFLALLLLTIWTALDYLENGSRRSLILCSCLLGLATLTRFSAPPLGLAIATVVLLRPVADGRRRLADVALFAAIGGSIFLGWVLFSQISNGRSIGRALWFYGNWGAAEWRAALDTLASWILPGEFPLMIRIPLLVMSIGFGVKAMLDAIARLRALAVGAAVSPSLALPAITGLFFLFYLMFLFLSVSIEANLSLTGRYAFPGYVALFMLIMSALATFGRRNPDRRLLFAGLLLVGLVFSTMQAARSAVRTTDAYRDGVGYQHRNWRTSPTLDAVRALPANAQILSNGPDIISFHTGRVAAFTPHEYMLRTGEPEPENPFDKQVDRLAAQAAAGSPVYVVMFDRVHWRHYLATEPRLIATLGAASRVQYNDGRIYKIGSRSDAAAGATGPGAGQ